ncbi:signal peptidase I [Cellulomonas sp. JH27-2]|uniref:signal peptidase I n=1 Tax=Cellulomonas sp. JH27-2 TaxID=2774139 RepID=UPI001787458B|nr:signal peptidase I [Cellulomonas sp. JH27-2]MBD8060520.1 signal peptidase I [Cellulomonas sp. JH27-2]
MGGVSADAGVQPEQERAGRQAKHSGWRGFVRETAIVVVCALVLSVVVKTFLVQAFFIPSESMEDTLVYQDRILVNKLAPGPFDLHRGDIVVFKDPGGWLLSEQEQPQTRTTRALHKALAAVGLYPKDAGEHLVKRIIGLPGDHVVCGGADSSVTVNGTALDEPYLAHDAVPCDEPFDTVVPADRLWVMGDNREHSADSHVHTTDPGGGSIPMGDVVGVAFVLVWPLSNATVLHNPAATFADVPDPS